MGAGEDTLEESEGEAQEATTSEGIVNKKKKRTITEETDGRRQR